jgi:hypothetical protein
MPAEGQPALEVGQHVFAEGLVAESGDGATLTTLADARIDVRGTTALPEPVVLAAPPADWEAFEGMRLRVEAPLTVTGNDALLRFGEVDLAFDGRLYTPTEIAAPGEGMISSVFKPYMTSYVKFERTNIDNAVSATAAEDAGNKTDSAAAHASVLRSATQLFAQARNAITRCVQLSTGQTLFDLYKEIADSMAAYAAGLQSRMPSPAQPSAASLARKLGR